MKPRSSTRLNELSALELAILLASRAITAEALVKDCLERIAERDAVVKAWVCVDAQAALARARVLDRQPRKTYLSGIPLGIKDIIDTADFPTTYGSRIYHNYQPRIDASVVATAQVQGLVTLGKTVTTEFAHRVPGPTTNPWDVNRTPGGSSSGSAAAVADMMVPFALGTQTTASTIRPASYCGVVGYRPTYGVMNCVGIKPNSPSFDSLGLFARQVADCSLLYDVLQEQTYEPLTTPHHALRIGFCRTPFWDKMQPEAAAIIERVIVQLSANGAIIEDVTVPEELLIASALHRTISSYELSRALGTERHQHYGLLSATIREGKIAEGMRVTGQDYARAQQVLEVTRARASSAWVDFDILIAPSASGIAPLGLSSTGASEFCTLWTALHGPTLSLPLPERDEGMPLGIQLIGKRGMDRQLFAAGLWIEQVLCSRY